MSSLNWKAQTEAELESEFMFPAGIYPAEVMEAEIRDDSKSRGFINLKLAVYNDDKIQHIFDNISPNWFAYKFKHFFDSSGHGDMYEKGVLPDVALIKGWGCTVELEIKDAHTGKDRFGAPKEYPASNVVEDYITGEIKAMHDATQAAKTAPADTSDDLPF